MIITRVFFILSVQVSLTHPGYPGVFIRTQIYLKEAFRSFEKSFQTPARVEEKTTIL